MTTKIDAQLDRSAAAALLGIAVVSVDKYRARGRLPEPDGYLGRSPWWYESTLTSWDADRPRRGQHGPQPDRKKPNRGNDEQALDDTASTERAAPRRTRKSPSNVVSLASAAAARSRRKATKR